MKEDFSKIAFDIIVVAGQSNEEATHNGDLDHFCKESILILGERYFDAFASLKDK